jgi:hypothetical protein
MKKYTIIMAKEQSKSKWLGLNLQIIDENYEMTELETYLKNELDTLAPSSNDKLWEDVKVQLGNKLIERDNKLLNYKTKYYYSLALNVGLVGYAIYSIVTRRS